MKHTPLAVLYATKEALALHVSIIEGAAGFLCHMDVSVNPGCVSEHLNKQERSGPVKRDPRKGNVSHPAAHSSGAGNFRSFYMQRLCNELE